MKQTGAIVSVKWLDNGEVEENLIVSFGTYDEKTDTDGFGRRDEDVFYYAKDVDELCELMVSGNDDFILRSYEVVVS